MSSNTNSTAYLAGNGRREEGTRSQDQDRAERVLFIQTVLFLWYKSFRQ